MRPIKFRAWHKTWRNALGSGMNLVKGLWWGKSGIGHVHLIEWADSTLLSDVELMQFTGLLDKNGKEIYEGDILLLHGLVGGKVGVVQWNAEKAKFESIRMDTTYGFKPQDEIIGNIYENPVLINE